MPGRRPIAAVGLALGLALAIPGGTVEAAGIVVDTLDDAVDPNGDLLVTDDGRCSFREAVEAADTDTAVGGCSAGSGADTITFAVSGTIQLSVGGDDPSLERPIGIDSELTVDGAGSITLRGGPIDTQAWPAPLPAFLAVGGRVSLVGLTIVDARLHNGGVLSIRDSALLRTIGGLSPAVENAGGQLAIVRSTISGSRNGRGPGGGIANSGDAVVVDSTITGNSAGVGGAIFNSGKLTIESSTIVGNTASPYVEWPQDAGGGIFNADGIIVVRGSIVAGNTPDDIDGWTRPVFPGTVRTIDRAPRQTITDSLVGIPDGLTLGDILDPAGLADNGGPTETIALVASPDNPAIDAAAASCTGEPLGGVDQRGLPRPVGAGCDIGAFEVQEPIERPTEAPSPTTTAPSAAPSETASSAASAPSLDAAPAGDGLSPWLPVTGGLALVTGAAAALLISRRSRTRGGT